MFRANLKPCGRGGIGRRIGLKRKLECSPGNRRCRTAQIRGTLENGDPEPSPVRNGREGVETRRAAPKPGAKSGHGEGIVQTPNPGKTAGAAKAVEGKKIRWTARSVRVQVPPPAPYGKSLFRLSSRPSLGLSFPRFGSYLAPHFSQLATSSKWICATLEITGEWAIRLRCQGG